MGITLWQLYHDDTGSDASEYALIAALVALVILGGVTTLGTNVNQMLENVAGYVPEYTGS